MLAGMQYVSKGQSDLFLTKYDPDGNIVWSTVIQGGNSGVWPGPLSVGRDGNPIFLGSTLDTIVIGKDTLRAPGPQSNVQFLTKMGSDGSVLWTIHSGGIPKHFWMDDLVSKHDDNIVLTGYVTGLGRFGDTPVGAIGPDSADVRPFLVQVSAAGRVQWVKQFEGIRGGRPKGLDQDTQGNIYFSANVGWSGYVIGSDTVRNPSGLAILLVKTDAAGRLLWHRNLAHTGGNYLDGLGVSADGSVYLKSRFATRIRPDQFMNYWLNSKGVVTNLVSKFDSLGNFEWYSLIPENTTILVVNPMGGLSADVAGNIHVLSRKGSQMMLAKIGKDRQSGIQDVSPANGTHSTPSSVNRCIPSTI